MIEGDVSEMFGAIKNRRWAVSNIVFGILWNTVSLNATETGLFPFVTSLSRHW